MKVLVTDAESTPSLAIIRSLGKKDIDCICTSTTRFAVSFFSKYCKKKIITSSPKENKKKFIEDIIEICKKEHIDVVFPIRGPSTLAISEYKKEIEDYASVPFEDFEKLKKFYDKSFLIDIAKKSGVLIPKTNIVNNLEDIENISDISYPLVLKPSRDEGASGVKYVKNKKELIEKYSALKLRYDCNIILQEYIRGIGYGCSVLFNFNSEIRTAFCHKRLRENPPSGGPSVARISTKWPELEYLTIRLMKSLKWRGIAMVEYKVTSDGVPYLIEVNPRFWGSLPLAIASGIDFPYMLFKMAVEGDIGLVKDYKEGVIARRLIMGDLQVFPYYLKNSKDKYNFMKDYFNFFGKNRYDDVLSIDDPCPIFGRVIWSPLALIGKGGME